jgi:hypothetical protein
MRRKMGNTEEAADLGRIEKRSLGVELTYMKEGI